MRRLAALVVLVAAGAAFALDTAGAGRVPVPQPTIERPGRCVDDPQVMRRNHMDMLKHDRDLTMRAGDRRVKASLKGCIDCHASAKTGTATGPGEFCESCHAYAAVKLDCFECHSNRARPAKAASPGTGFARVGEVK